MHARKAVLSFCKVLRRSLTEEPPRHRYVVIAWPAVFAWATLEQDGKSDKQVCVA